MADLGHKYTQPSIASSSRSKKSYPHVTVPAEASGLASAKIGQRIDAQISGHVTSMHAGGGMPHEVGVEVHTMRQLKQEKLRRAMRRRHGG